MFWQRAKPNGKPTIDLEDASKRFRDFEDQIDRMRAANDELQSKLVASDTTVVGYEEAFRRVGEGASYRLKKAPEESWPDYKRRVMSVFENGRDSDIVRVILDLLAFKEREGYRSWISAKEPAEAEVLRQSCAGFRKARQIIQQALVMAGSRGLEDRLHEEKDFSALDLDDMRLASPRRGH